MSSKSKKMSTTITQQKVTTAVQVLSIMQNEALQMSWFQRFRISQSFLWKKNIDCFFGIATKNRKKAKNAEKVQDS